MWQKSLKVFLFVFNFSQQPFVQSASHWSDYGYRTYRSTAVHCIMKSWMKIRHLHSVTHSWGKVDNFTEKNKNILILLSQWCILKSCICTTILQVAKRDLTLIGSTTCPRKELYFLFYKMHLTAFLRCRFDIQNNFTIFYNKTHCIQLTICALHLNI